MQAELAPWIAWSVSHGTLKGRVQGFKNGRRSDWP